MFRFTIRDVLWLTVVVGLGVGWRLNWSALNKNSDGLRHSLEMAQYDRDLWKDAAGEIQRQSDEWERSAREQERRAEYVSDQLYDRKRLKQQCPECGSTVTFGPMAGKPWSPPEDSHWQTALPTP